MGFACATVLLLPAYCSSKSDAAERSPVPATGAPSRFRKAPAAGGGECVGASRLPHAAQTSITL